ncbi:MAG: Hsp20/alpha crystallin family protein [Opitutus sp.]|nr:Hsp20/alpha crystallin family protein [Opitutus sp.]
MTHLFNQIVPRLSRAIRREEPASTDEARRSEFTLKPAYDLQETAEAWGLVVQLPGVAKDGLELTVEEGLVRLVGRRAWRKPEGWTQLYRESVDAAFELELTHDNSIDPDKIVAELKDGVLRVSLPKTEAVKPRKIAVS